MTVICASSAYAGTDTSPEPSGVRVLRVKDLPFQRSMAGRIASYLSFFPSALWLALRAPQPDLVVTLTTPPLAGCLGTILKRFKGVRHVVWEMDMYPEISIALGVLRERGVTARLTGALMRWSRQHADRVIALGECMRDRLIEIGVPRERIAICENWANGQRIGPRQDFALQPLTVIYPGNLGLGHEAATLQDLIAGQAANPHLRFTFVGGGRGYEALRRFCQQEAIANTTFLPYRAVDAFAPLLQSASIGLVTQKANCAGYLVPSKVYPIMAAGLALLYIGPATATPARLIRRFHCGWHFECGDGAGLAALFETLAANPEIAHRAGERARQAFLEYYDLPVALPRLAAAFGIPVGAPEPTGQGVTANTSIGAIR